jgi:hypothetical protein
VAEFDARLKKLEDENLIIANRLIEQDRRLAEHDSLFSQVKDFIAAQTKTNETIISEFKKTNETARVFMETISISHREIAKTAGQQNEH